jgi:small-conductance mechanosensitive channel
MSIREIIEYKLLETEKFSITVYQLLVFTLILLITWLLLRLIRAIVNRRIKKYGLQATTTYSIFQIFRYVIWILAIGAALETIGIKFNLLIASSAALLVGLGLGLQQLFMDYVAGIIILFEGVIKVNDVVEIGDLVGEVRHIGLRTSKIETRDDYMIVVPNHKLVNDMLINWSHNRRLTRFNVEVGVAYGSNVRLVEKVLLECARENKEISNHPPSFVRFRDFGNSSLDFQLFFWTENTFRVENIKSMLRFAIDGQFRTHKIRIPFPQRDVHIIDQKGNKS